ncbi:uncharacterized protein LOC117654267 [Thrips palmi]|uniref:Uncharacterized protein LOC117654267 n=1 Tax=Thrips palmi TaxID=161013 RepID=A0A6P9AEA6_THRPL|nr:uncharacterized protein LOC117654267 [Thrips palmi]
MTVSYQYEVASSTSGGFTRLLFMWKGSLYKLIYRELLLFLLAFGILSALYRNLFTAEQKRLFVKVVVYCDTFINLIPLSFVLGFYVAYVAARWWNQYLAIPWPDKIMHSIALYVQGNDDHARMTRRNLMRYLNLTLILVLRSISSAVKRRFPKLDHLVEAGFMTPTELQIYLSVPSVEFNTYWIPCTWFIHLLKETRRSNRIADPQGLKIIMEEFNQYRSQCGMLWSYDWVSIPLVYTQVVTIATYSFFLAALVGRQYVEDSKSFQMEIDIYLPVFTILQFFFYMGLLKVAEQLINPFGDDDEDFELNWLIDRHTKVSYLGVDTLMTRSPPLVKDLYYNDVDMSLPYTEAASAYKRKTYRGSVHNMVVPEEQHGMFLPEIEEEDESASLGMRTPKTSILSLHKVGLSSQSHQQQPGQQAGAGAANKKLKSAAAIWRRNSDKSRKGEDGALPPAAGGAAVRTAAVGSAGSATGPTAVTGPRGGAKSSTASAGSVGSEADAVLQASAPARPVGGPVPRNESFHSWKSFFSSLGGSRKDHDSSSPSAANSEESIASSEDDDVAQQAAATAEAAAAGPRNSNSSSGSSGAATAAFERRNSSSQTPSPRPGRPGRPRLQSCPKLLVLVGRNDSTSSTSRDGRKKGVRWKPVLDDVRGGPSSVRRRDSDEDPAHLCRCCRERRVDRDRDRHLFLRRPAVRRRPWAFGRGLDQPEMSGSAPDLGAHCAFVRDETYWRGGKFPGTPPVLALGQRAGSRGILKKMMFWRGSGGVACVGELPGALVDVEGAAAGGNHPCHASTHAVGNVVDTILTVEASPVSRSLPDIAAIRKRIGSRPFASDCVALPALPGVPDKPDTPVEAPVETPVQAPIQAPTAPSNAAVDVPVEAVEAVVADAGASHPAAPSEPPSESGGPSCGT